MILLETESLTKSFGALRAVSEVDLAVEEGQVHSIIGPNGAGKTTLFNLLSGVYSPTAGRITFRGEDITSYKLFQRSRLGLGRSFQITSLFPELSVLENLRLAVQSRGGKNFNMFRKATDMKEVEEKAMAILDKLKLRKFKDQKAGTIPYGSQRSLDMAIAVATEPILLLLDEPTSGMTPEDTHEMIGLIKGLSADHTIVLIEHHMNVVMSISDKITVLHQGQIIAQDNPEAIRGNEEVKRAYFGGISE